MDQHTITEVTRRGIIDFFVASETPWYGRLNDVEFLSRVYDLTKMPSTDSRIRTARGDISQHRISWQDWTDDWIFTDSRFNLMGASDEDFLRFLCETIHPVVRPDSKDARALASEYNSYLRPDGWQLVESKQISGKPVFTATRLGRSEVFTEPTGWQKVDRQIQEMRARLDAADSEEDWQTVGLLCRETLISVAQEVYDPISHPTLDGTDPSSTDAGRMLEAVIAAELRGSPNEEARIFARSALKLALALQHKRTADFRMAALCAEATIAVVNISAVLAGRR